MRAWRRALAALALAWACTAIAMAALQDRYLYFPEALDPARLAADARAAALVPWPADGEPRGLLRPPPGPVRGTVVVFHGNAGHALHRSWYADALADLGLRVILAEYPGYGPRGGALGEASLVADARQTVARARREFGGPLVLAGESLGAGVAAAVAAVEPVDALLLITPWKDLAGVAAHHYPWLPVRWVLRDRYDSAANLRGFRGRCTVVVAERDSIIPGTHGRALYDGLPAAGKRLLVVPGADHNDWALQVGADWWQQLVDGLLSD